MSAAIEGGTIWLLRLFDVGDAIRLDAARELASSQGARRGATVLKGPERGAGGVMLASEPLDIDLGTVEVEGLQVRTGVRLFDFGVASVRIEVDIAPGMPFESLVRTAASLEGTAAVDEAARAICQRVERDLAASIQSPHTVDIVEDYTVFEIRKVRGCASGQDVLDAIDPAQLLLAEPERAVADVVRESYRKRPIQYYASDAVVIGWNSSLVVDPEGGADVMEVLEIATAQLLELRYYDALLGRELAQVYDAAQAARRATSLFRSPFVHVARRAATLFIEMTDLADRLQGAVTLVGDAYTARLYGEASHRLRLDEIGRSVREKLRTLETVTEILEGEIGHRRATVLESTVVLLIVLEVVLGLVKH